MGLDSMKVGLLMVLLVILISWAMEIYKDDSASAPSVSAAP